MFRRFFHAAALVILCALLVYAPELYTAVSGPAIDAQPERVLLRVALCTQDADSVSSFYSALAGYRKAQPAVHLRVTRADVSQLASLPDPRPDVYLFPEGSSLPAASLFMPLAQEGGANGAIGYTRAFRPSSGETLLCAVSSRARAPSAALSLIDTLCSAKTEDVP